MRDATSDRSVVRRRWEEGEGFRETLASRLANDEERETVRRFGALFFRLLLERSGPGSRAGLLEPSSTWTELSAILAELRHLSAYLEEVGRGWRDHDLAPEDAKLSRFAARFVGRVRRLAEKLEEELGRSAREGELRP